MALDDLAPPDWLDGTGRAFWERYAPELRRLGLLTVLDVPLFAAACEQESLYRRLMRVINRAPTGKRAQTLAARATKALEERDRILGRFGFDPASRAKLATQPPRDEDEFEALLRRRPRREA